MSSLVGNRNDVDPRVLRHRLTSDAQVQQVEAAIVSGTVGLGNGGCVDMELER